MKRIITYLAFITFLFSCNSDDAILSELSDDTDTTQKVNLPELQTSEVTDISLYSVKIGGKLIDSGDSDIIEVGLVVGTTTLPTISNNLNKFIVTPSTSSHFNLVITNVPANTTYYVRAYGINSNGIGYGNEVQFKSLEENVFDGTITLSTQEDVNNFGSNNYTTVTGRVYIQGSVISLKSLNSLVIIEGSLEINNTTDLENLIGLENLKVTGRHILLGSTFEIRNNSSLRSLKGLNGLIEIGAHYFTITNNHELENLDGLNSLKIITNNFSVRIGSNDNMVSLSGLEKLEQIAGDLIFDNLTKINDLSALSNLYHVGGRIRLSDNNSLENITGLEAISSLEGLELTNNDNLTNLNGLVNLSEISEINISYNTNLNDLSVFQNINTLKNLSIANNNSLINLGDFSNLTSVEEGLNISDNPNLTSLNGIENLNSVQRLRINSNPSLTNLEGLNGLTTITGNSYLTISNNSNLNSLSGLEKLIEMKGYIQIFSNSTLSDFCALKDLFANEGHIGSINFSENLDNPSTDEIINNCN